MAHYCSVRSCTDLVKLALFAHFATERGGEMAGTKDFTVSKRAGVPSTYLMRFLWRPIVFTAEFRTKSFADHRKDAETRKEKNHLQLSQQTSTF